MIGIDYEWKDDDRMFHSGKLLYAGKWAVGVVEYRSRTKGDKNNYAACSMLPGIKDVLDFYETEELAKRRVEKATHYWINNLLNLEVPR